jgi:hypothetical protein
MSQNRVLRRIFEAKREAVTEGWKKIHNEELYDSYYSPNIIRLLKYRRIKLVGYEAFMGKMNIFYRVWFESLENQAHLEVLSLDGKITLKWTLNKMGRSNPDSSGLG